MVSCSMRSSISSRSRVAGIARQGQRQAHARDGRAQFVRDPAQQAAFTLDLLAQPGRHGVKVAHQVGDLVAAIAQVLAHMNVEIAASPVHGWHRADARWAWSDNARSPDKPAPRKWCPASTSRECRRERAPTAAVAPAPQSEDSARAQWSRPRPARWLRRNDAGLRSSPPWPHRRERAAGSRGRKARARRRPPARTGTGWAATGYRAATTSPACPCCSKVCAARLASTGISRRSGWIHHGCSEEMR